LNCQAVCLAVAFGGHDDIGPFFGKSGRIEDHDIVIEGLGAEKVKSAAL
jgi:hypothetical protein